MPSCCHCQPSRSAARFFGSAPSPAVDAQAQAWLAAGSVSQLERLRLAALLTSLCQPHSRACTSTLITRFMPTKLLLAAVPLRRSWSRRPPRCPPPPPPPPVRLGSRLLGRAGLAHQLAAVCGVHEAEMQQFGMRRRCSSLDAASPAGASIPLNAQPPCCGPYLCSHRRGPSAL